MIGPLPPWKACLKPLSHSTRFDVPERTPADTDTGSGGCAADDGADNPTNAGAAADDASVRTPADTDTRSGGCAADDGADNPTGARAAADDASVPGAASANGNSAN